MIIRYYYSTVERLQSFGTCCEHFSKKSKSLHAQFMRQRPGDRFGFCQCHIWRESWVGHRGTL